MYRIIYIADKRVFLEIGNAIKRILPNCIEQETYESNDNDISFVFAGLRDVKHDEIKGKKILFQTEELWNRREKNHYDLSFKYNNVFEIYKENTKMIRGTENVIWCPLGYMPEFEGNYINVSKDIDVLFYGSLTPRRLKILEEIKKYFNIVIKEGVFDEERDLLIKRSKIVLNIKAHDKWLYGPIHCLLSQCKKSFTLSEAGDGGYDPFNKNDIEEFTLDNMIEKINYWLKNEEKREERAQEIYNNIKNNISFDINFKKCLNKIK